MYCWSFHLEEEHNTHNDWLLEYMCGSSEQNLIGGHAVG